uniref:BTB domain-containing protein n=1 Tax=Panagrellus redivivus TaxID=6233 RepID=A0A7E4UV79_PANRE
MSMSMHVSTFKDSTTFTLRESFLTGMKDGPHILTPKRSISIDGLQWWIDYQSSFCLDSGKEYLSMYLCVNQAVKATYTFAVDGSSISRKLTHEFTKPDDWGYPCFASHEQLRPIFRNGKLTITCKVEFEVMEPVISVPRVCQLFEHVPTDVELVIGSDRVPVHKNFITMISPVFQAMITHNTTESESGEIEITEFDFATVKAAIDICYGRESPKMPIEAVIGILCFCDRYVITAVINELEKLILFKLSVENFCTIVEYAYDCNKESLLTACHNYFKTNQKKIKVTKQFAKLPPRLVRAVLKAAFGLKTDYDVLRHAHKNGMEFVMTYLEQFLINSMTMDHFCTAVNFAWGYSRQDLKKACVKYFNDNRDEVLSLNTFYMLHSQTIGNLMKTSYFAK